MGYNSLISTVQLEKFIASQHIENMKMYVVIREDSESFQEVMGIFSASEKAKECCSNIDLGIDFRRSYVKEYVLDEESIVYDHLFFREGDYDG